MLYNDCVYVSIRGEHDLRIVSVFALETYQSLSQLLEGDARISFLEWVRGNPRLRALKELLASATSKDNELKSRDNSWPAFVAVCHANTFWRLLLLLDRLAVDFRRSG
jgi:hypothetical protein